MNINNNATRLRRELFIHVAKKIFNKTITKDLDRIPVEMIPKSKSSNRCCVYKDRALLKYRLMHLLGFDAEDEVDETKLLTEYAKEAIDSKPEKDQKLFSILHLACQSCAKTKYIITNACQGCLARPCQTNCPKNAVEFVNNRAVIDQDKCINCGKCQPECKYQAISHIPIPCEEACPVKAIYKTDDEKVHIDDSKCIHCGKCFSNCPFGAVLAKSQIVPTLNSIESEEKTIAIFAPAIAGQFAKDIEVLATAIKDVGFDDVYQAATGADITIEKEREELMEHEGLLTTSCCPSYVELVNKHIPGLEKNVSTTKSPMHYTAEIVKEKYPDSKVVFIGPCLAKQNEARQSDLVDYTLSFEELGAIFVAKEVEVLDESKSTTLIGASKWSKGFAQTSGVTAAIVSGLPADYSLKNEVIDGISKKSIARLKAFSSGALKADFIEVMACEGGCVGGPFTITNSRIAANRINKILAINKT